MQATKEMLTEWKRLYLKTHTYPSTETYYSFLKRYVGDNGIEINQNTVDKFRENNMSYPASASLKTFCKFLFRKYSFPEDILNIRYDKSKQSARFPKSIPLTDVELLINNMESLKTKVLTRFIFECGLRLSESLSLLWQDINFSEWINNKNDYGKVTILKTKRGKFRTIPISPGLMQLMYSVSKLKTPAGVPTGNLIFDFGASNFITRPENSNEKNLYDYICYAENFYRGELYKISKLMLNRRISPHYLRHSRSQILLDRGFSLDSLKSFLGHVSIASTEVYAQASSEKVKRELMAYDILTRKNETAKQPITATAEEQKQV